MTDSPTAAPRQVPHTPGPWAVEDGVVVSVPFSQIVMTTVDGELQPHDRGLVAVVSGHLMGEGDLIYTQAREAEVSTG